MNASFDPYHRWLGIAPEQQPPNHYRLLGLQLFESDPDVIESAADRQMAHVRNFQSGEHAQHAQEILNNIAAAKLTLLDATEKSAYDAQLKAEGNSEDPWPEQEIGLPSPLQGVPAGTPIAELQTASAQQQARIDAKPRKKTRIPAGVVGGGIALVFALLLLVAVIAFNKPWEAGIATNGNPVAAAQAADSSERGSAAADTNGQEDVPPSPSENSNTGEAVGDSETPQLAQTDLGRADEAVAVSSPETDEILRAVKTAVESKQLVDTPLIGKAGYRRRFRSYLPEGGLLVGVKLSTGRFGRGYKYRAVASIQGFYLTPQGIVAGKTNGPVKGNARKLMAAEGYAVGGMKVKVAGSHPRIRGIQLVFMRIDGDKLDPEDAYLSPAYRDVPADAPLLGGDGTPIVGIHGWWAKQEQRGLGLIQAPTRPRDNPQETAPREESAETRQTLAEGDSHQEKSPVPDQADRDAVRAKAATLFDVDQADTAAERAQMAQTLLTTAKETNDPVERFALLNMARELAANAAEIGLAFDAMDLLEGHFDFDAAPVRMATLGAAVKAPVPAKQKRDVVAAGIDMIDRLMVEDEYDTAGKLALPLLKLAREANYRELTNALVSRRKRAAELYTAFQKAEAALAVLEKEPENGEANLTVGKFYLIAKRDWSRALPFLAKGSDEQLAAAARAEMRKPLTTEQEHQLANAWWNIATNESNEQAQRLIQTRSMHWYQRADSGLTGLAKAKARKRIKQVLAQTGADTKLLWERKRLKYPSRVWCTQFAPDQATLAAGTWKGTLHLRDLDTGQELWAVQAHKGRIPFVGFSPDGRVVTTTSYDKHARLWNAKNGKLLGEVDAHDGTVRAAPVSPHGRTFATASDDTTIKIWDTRTLRPIHTLTGHTVRAFDVQYSHNGKLLASAGWDKTVRIWRLSNRSEGLTLKGHQNYACKVAFSPDDELLASCCWNEIRIWDVASGRGLRRLDGYARGPRCVTFNPRDGTLASSHRGGLIMLWDPRSGEKLQQVDEGSGDILRVAFSPDGKLLASSGGDDVVRIWDVHASSE